MTPENRVICVFVFEAHSKIFTVTRGRSIGLPRISTYDDRRPIEELAREALGSSAQVNNIGIPVPFEIDDSYEGTMFLYQCVGADIVPLKDGASWDNIWLRDPRFDETVHLARKAKSNSKEVSTSAA